MRVAGYALNRQEDSDGVFAVAVPVHSPDGTAYLGSLSLTRPDSPAEETRIPMLVAAAVSAAKAMGQVLPRGAEVASSAAGRSY